MQIDSDDTVDPHRFQQPSNIGSRNWNTSL
jgi:hypothetical protein